MTKFRYIKRWDNNRAQIEVNNQIYDIYMTSGKPPLRFYVAKRDGIEIVSRPRLQATVNYLGRLKAR